MDLTASHSWAASVITNTVLADAMPDLTVAVIASPGYAKDLGKRGTSSDITLYDAKRGQDTVSFIEPTKYPERLAPLFYACSIADAALVVVEEVNAQFGECVIMLDALKVQHGVIILKNYIPRETLAPLLKGTVLESYAFVDEDFVALRESFLDEAAARVPGEESGQGSVTVDHHFNVKGVGTVILGHVVRGAIHRHDDLRALPGTKTAQVRSIQKHDDDFDVATIGDRVGLALKGIDSEDLDRGFVLTNQEDVRCSARISARATLVKYWPSPLKEGMVMHVGHWMQFLPARVASISEGSDARSPMVELVMEKELVHPSGSRAVLCYLDGGKLRVAGSIELP